MKVAAATMLILVSIGFLGLILPAQPTYTDCRSTMITENSQFGKETAAPTATGQDQACESWNIDTSQDESKRDTTISGEDGNQSEPILDDAYQDQEDIERERESCPEPCPPDGHVYYGSDAPYAYVPTFNPKKWANMTLAPPIF